MIIAEEPTGDMALKNHYVYTCPVNSCKCKQFIEAIAFSLSSNVGK